MKSVSLAGAFAGSLSIVSLLLCLAAVPYLIAEIQAIRSELDAQMSEFRVTTTPNPAPNPSSSPRARF